MKDNDEPIDSFCALCGQKIRPLSASWPTVRCELDGLEDAGNDRNREVAPNR
jgi:hypothetical protein